MVVRVFVAAVALMLFDGLMKAEDGPAGGATDRTAASGPALRRGQADTYVVIRIGGPIGRDFESYFEDQLVAAKGLRAKVIILDISTPGGRATYVEKIVDRIIESGSFRFIALVRRALCDGAAIPLACKEIYVTRTATMGGAVNVLRDSNGRAVALPPDVGKKLEAARRAVCRKAADWGGAPVDPCRCHG